MITHHPVTCLGSINFHFIINLSIVDKQCGVFNEFVIMCSGINAGKNDGIGCYTVTTASANSRNTPVRIH